MSFEVVKTREGASAVLDHDTREVMHPIIGPLLEAAQFYVGPSGLAARLAEGGAKPLVLLDVGLGAGSNAIAAWRVSEALPSSARRLEIVSFDRTLDALELALAHASDFGFDGDAGIAAHTVCARGEHETARTTWRFHGGELPGSLDAQGDATADLVFWDPFSPKSNPTLWTVAAFTALRRVCRAGCTVQTYSGATAVRSALLLAGFAVGLGEPIGAGKQGTRAALGAEELASPLGARWLERVQRSSAPLPADAPADAMLRLAQIPQLSRP